MAPKHDHVTATCSMDDLTDAQRSGLQLLKQRLAPEAKRLEYLNDESYLLAWLRGFTPLSVAARKFNVDLAETFLRNHLRFRQALRMDEFDTFSKSAHPLMDEFYPHGQFGHDREGRPVIYFPFGTIDVKGLFHAISVRDGLSSVMVYAEQSYMHCKNASRKFGKAVNQVVYVLDLKGICTKHMWKPGLEVFQQIARIVEQHTPDILYKVFVINAPAIFHVIYRIFKPILDDHTQRKVHVYGSDGWRDKLLQQIAPDQLPAHYGGNCYAPDGDPKCSHAIVYGSEVPKELYLTPEDKEALLPEGTVLTEVTVGRGQKQILTFTAKQRGAVFFWYLESSSGQDIGFCVYRAPDSNNNDCLACPDLSHLEMAVPYFRVLTHLVPEYGYLVADRPATYVLELDNSYSWLSAKHLKCYVTVESPKSPLIPLLPLTQTQKCTDSFISCPVIVQ